jgi:hypothetical protein
MWRNATTNKIGLPSHSEAYGRDRERVEKLCLSLQLPVTVEPNAPHRNNTTMKRII